MRVDVIDTIDSLNQVRDNWESVYRADPEAHYFLSWAWIANWLEPRSGAWLVLAAKPDDETRDYAAFLPLKLPTTWMRTAISVIPFEWAALTLPPTQAFCAIRNTRPRPSTLSVNTYGA